MSTPEADLASMSRAAQRKMRLVEIERQQHLEDLEALKMTEEQRLTLWRSFHSVKMEFADLDGLCWTPSALLTRCQRLSTLSPPTRSRRPSRPSSPPSSPSAFAVLTNTDFTSSDDTTTIRAPRQHSSQPQLRSTRSRSPVKGVFTGRDTHAHGDDLFSPSNPPRLLVAGLDHNASDLVRPQIRRPIGTSPNVPSPPSPGRNSALTSPSSSLLPPRQLPIVQPIRVVPVANAMSEADDDDGLKTPVSVRSYSDYGQRGSTKRKR